jgi:hypothetical protein
LERALGPEHPEVAIALRNLAVIHHCRREYERAEELYRRGLDIREKAFGPAHPATRRSRQEYAQLLRDAGEVVRALRR